jgi:hypothetical protein
MQSRSPQNLYPTSKRSKEASPCQENLILKLKKVGDCSSQKNASIISVQDQNKKLSSHLRISSLFSDAETPKQCSKGLISNEDPIGNPGIYSLSPDFNSFYIPTTLRNL